jgi:hypothetical protein
MASEKQMNYIKSLYEDFQKTAGTIEDPEIIKDLAEKIAPFKDSLVAVMKDEDISFQTASDLIGLLKGINESNAPASSKIRWKKIGAEWLISGSAEVLIEGNEVEVTSRKGTQKVTVGRIHSNKDGIVLAYPMKDKAVENVTPGYYWKDEQIIEAYHTKNGFLVARTIVDNKKGDYLGKAGLKGLGEKLTLDEIKELGRVTGRCMICSKELTDPVSIEIGIGPVCLANGGY